MENKYSDVAIVMSVYINDRCNYVRDALNSLYEQTYPVDVYVQKDGPLPSELSSFLDDELLNNRLMFLGARGVNEGLAYSLNQLIGVVMDRSYKYIARMDADDISRTKRIEKQLIFLEEHLDVDVCGTYINEFSEEYEQEKVVRYPLVHDDMLNFFKYRVPIAHVSAMFRSDFFNKCGMYPVSGHISNEDMLLWLKAFQTGCVFANIPYVGVSVRVGNSFFARRAGLKKVVSDFRNRMLVAKTLKFGVVSYVVAFSFVMLSIMPPILKKYLYLHLR